MPKKQSKSKKSVQENANAQTDKLNLKKAVLARLDDGTIQLTISIPSIIINATQEKVIEEFVKDVQIPGFRKGKAPIDLASKHLDKQKVYEHTLQHLLPEFYADAIQAHNLRPVLAPKFELISVEEDKDWEVRAITCELPEIDLGKYKEKVKANVAGSKVNKNQPKNSSKTDEASREEKEQRVIKALLESVDFVIPKPLIEEEVNHKLSGLLDQVQRLGLTVEQYLASSGKNIETLKSEYTEQAKDSIKVVLLLNKIGETEKVEIKDTEINDVITASLTSVGDDEKAKEQLESDDQKRLIRSILIRRKALDVLAGLV